MNIKGVGIGRGVAVGPVIRMAAPLPEPSDAPRAESISAETEIARVEKSLALVNADLNRRAEEAANGDEGAKQAAPILQAIAMFASDPSLAQSIKDLINQGKTAERAEAFQHGALSGLALLDERVDALRERRVGGEHGDGLQDRSSLLGAFVAVRGLFGTAVQIRVDQRQRLGHALDLGFGRDTVGARRIGRFGKRSCHTNDRADRNAASDANTLDNHMFSLCYGLSPRMTGTSHPRTALLTHQLHRR